MRQEEKTQVSSQKSKKELESFTIPKHTTLHLHRLRRPFPCMHYRVLRLSPSANTSPFACALQAAAGRAWTRRASLQTYSVRTAIKFDKKNRQTGLLRYLEPTLAPSGSRRSTYGPVFKPIGVVWRGPPLYPPKLGNVNQKSFLPQAERQPRVKTRLYVDRVYDSDFEAHPSQSYPYDSPTRPNELSLSCSGRPWYWDHCQADGVLVSSNLSPIRPHPGLPAVKSKTSLYQNLLYLILFRRPGLPVLLDYHDLHSRWKSTGSYNLLISTALRHSAFGTVRWLLTNMADERIPRNLETIKFRTRWLVQTGRWDQAWEDWMRLSSEVPLPIWLEFFGTRKRGSRRLISNARQKPDTHGNLIMDTGRKPPQEFSAEHIKRHRLLLKHRPTISPHDSAKFSLRIIYHVVSSLLRIDQDAAETLTRSYFKCLPKSLDSKMMLQCLDIIHLLIAHGSKKQGLAKFMETRKTMEELIQMHPSLRPTATTLHLLLSPLRKALRCGTIAVGVVKAFKERWGVDTENSRVRRRVVVFALKEGRLNIARRFFELEEHHNLRRKSWMHERQILGGSERSKYKKLWKSPARRIYKRDGAERRLWMHLYKRTF